MHVEHAPDSEVLWHYTSTDGLLGIVQNKQLWATDALYLNDNRELLEGLDLLSAQVRQEVGRANEKITSVKQLWLALHQFDRNPQIEPPSGIAYVACFCTERDLLSQWRNYADGSGFAIGFSRTGLELVARQVGGELVEVSYLSDELPSTADGPLFGSTFFGGGEGPRIVADAGSLAKYKHHAFKEEREWRLIVPSQRSMQLPNDDLPKVGFRRGALGLTPYIALELALSCIRELMVGPGSNQDLRRLAAQRLLSGSGSSASTSCSAAPFRG